MASRNFLRFRQSMNIGYEQWHDGIGYDLEALGRLKENERKIVEDILVSRKPTDWRDIEALEYLGSARAIEEIEKALKNEDIDVRIMAAEKLASRNQISEVLIESLILEALETTNLLNGMVSTLRFAEKHPTICVQLKLLWCARYGNSDIRAHAAALAHFLYGKSSSSFDWSFRPLYLRFNSTDEKERESAFYELCRNVGVSPKSVDMFRKH